MLGVLTSGIMMVYASTGIVENILSHEYKQQHWQWGICGMASLGREYKNIAACFEGVYKIMGMLSTSFF